MNIPWRRDRLPTPTFLGSLVPQMVKNGRLHLIHGLGRSHESEGGYDNTLQCSCLKNSMDRGAWQATVHGVAKSQMQLSLIKKKWKKYSSKESVERTKEGTWKAFSQCIFTSIPHKLYLHLLCLKER